MSIGNKSGHTLDGQSVPEPAAESTTMASEVARVVQEMKDNKRKASLQMGKIRRVIARDITTVGSGNNIQGRRTDSEDSTQGRMQLLGIGNGGVDDFTAEGQHAADGCVSESPTAVDFDVYDRACQSELNRTRSQRVRPTAYPRNVLERNGDGAGELLALGRLSHNVQDGVRGEYPVSPDGLSGLPVSAKNISLVDVVTCAMEESQS